jgi:protein phosphatase
MTEAFGLSDAGRFRRHNEDSLVCDTVLNLFVVADGMGGQAGGEIASRLAVEAIEEFIQASAGSDYVTWPFGFNPTLSEGANRLNTAVMLANQRIISFARAYEEYTGMGSTAVCALMSGPELTVAHVGDSRLYLFSGETLTQMTKDDSWVAGAVSLGHDQSALRTHPHRHVLTNVLGVETQTEVHLAERVLTGGDLLLLCSDGLHGSLDHETLQQLVGGPGDLETRAHALVSAAFEAGSRDNVTALLARYVPD